MDEPNDAEIRKRMPAEKLRLGENEIHGLQQSPVKDVEKGLAAGARIGDFRVIAPIGAGGMSSVYEVEDVELGGPHYALKFFNPKSGDPDGRLLKRFKREIQILQAITDKPERKD